MAVGLSTWACSKSTTAPGAFTQTQASELFSELSAVSATVSTVGFTRSGNPSGGPSLTVTPRPAYDVETAINATGSCPSGGTVAISGNVNPNASGLTFGFTDTWTNCQTAHFLVNGSTTENGSFTYTSGTSPSTSGSLTETGALNVAPTSGPPFSCTINLTMTVSGASSSTTVSWTGSICGVNVSGTV